MDRPDVARSDRNALWRLLSRKVKKLGREILTQSSLKFSICVIEILDRYLWYFGNYALFGNPAISVIFSSFFIITFDWIGNFKFWWFYRKDIVKIYQNIPYLKFKNIFYLKKSFLVENSSGKKSHQNIVA